MTDLVERLATDLSLENAVSDAEIYALGKYCIPDIPHVEGAAKVNVVFLIESPHVDEVKHRHPLAGSSGTFVTRAFRRNGVIPSTGSKIPIGCLLNCAAPLALVNVSQLPLERSAYDSRQWSSELDRLLNSLEGIKSALDKVERESESDISAVSRLKLDDFSREKYQIILDDFTSRVLRILHLYAPKWLVPCGRVARLSLKLARSGRLAIGTDASVWGLTFLIRGVGTLRWNILLLTE